MLDSVVFRINCSVFKGRFCGPIVVFYRRQGILLLVYLTVIATTFVPITSLAMRGLTYEPDRKANGQTRT